MQSSLRQSVPYSYTGLTLGKVFSVHPEANMVDVMLLNGTILRKVQVMVPFASSCVGGVNLPLPKYKKQGDEISMINRDNPLKEAAQDEVDVFVVVGFFGKTTRPIVLGFLFPENCEVLCSQSDQTGNQDGTQFLWKHSSNIYARLAKGATKDKTPELEISHPSGLFIKIGGDDKLTEIKNYDKKVRPFKHKNPDNDEFSNPPIVHLYHPSGTYLTIGTDGKVSVYAISDMDKTVKGNLTETIDGNVVRTIKGNLTETVEGDTTETTEGDETNTVNGKWLRQSDTEIEDKCGTIHHNK